MARILYPEGHSDEVQPGNGLRFSLEELQTLVGGYIEVVLTQDGRYLVLDDNGKLKHKPINREATAMYMYGDHDPMVGVVVLIDTKEEFNEPDDEEEDDDGE